MRTAHVRYLGRVYGEVPAIATSEEGEFRLDIPKEIAELILGDRPTAPMQHSAVYDWDTNILYLDVIDAEPATAKIIE